MSRPSGPWIVTASARLSSAAVRRVSTRSRRANRPAFSSASATRPASSCANSSSSPRVRAVGGGEAHRPHVAPARAQRDGERVGAVGGRLGGLEVDLARAGVPGREQLRHPLDHLVDRELGVGDERRAADQREPFAVTFERSSFLGGGGQHTRDHGERDEHVDDRWHADQGQRGDQRDAERRDHRGVAHHSPGGASSMPDASVEPDEVEDARHLPDAADDPEGRAEVAGELDDEPDARGVQERRRAQVEHDLGVRLSLGGAELGLQGVHRGQVDLPCGYDDDRVARAPTRHREVLTALHAPRSSQGARRTTSPGFLSDGQAIDHEAGKCSRCAE